MRISDWSSDVCSSDLRNQAVADARGQVLDAAELAHGVFQVGLVGRVVFALLAVAEDAARHAVEILAGILDDVGGAVDHGIEQAAQHGIGIGAQAGLALGAGDELAERQRIGIAQRSEEHTSELQALMRSSYAVFGLNKTKHAARRECPTASG